MTPKRRAINLSWFFIRIYLGLNKSNQYLLEPDYNEDINYFSHINSSCLLVWLAFHSITLECKKRKKMFPLQQQNKQEY